MDFIKNIFDPHRIQLKNWTKERLETFIFNETTVEHLHRYAFARVYARDRKILDVASGEGYGSSLLAESAREVIGVDIDQGAVDRAVKKYVKSNLTFLQGTTTQLPVRSASIDVAVSFETLEHLEEHDPMLIELKRVMCESGILIISSPDKFYYSDQIGYRNPHHRRELYEKEFRNLMLKYFQYCRFYYQRYVKGSLIVPEAASKKMTTYSGGYTHIQEEGTVWGRFLICVASNRPLPDLDAGQSMFVSEGIC